MHPNRRSRIVVDRPLQSRIALIVLLASASAVFMQTALTSYTLNNIASELPNDGRIMMEGIPASLAANAGWTLLFTVPWLIFLSFLGTFRVFGPLVRIRNYMREILAGEHGAELTVRKGDYLQDVCGLVNEITEPRRQEIIERKKSELAAESEGQRELDKAA